MSKQHFPCVAAWGRLRNFVTVIIKSFYQEISVHVLASFVKNTGFLFATSSRKIISHVVESQITLLFWPCLSLTEKTTQLITWSFLMMQLVSFTSAEFEAFAEVYLWSYLFEACCLGKKDMLRQLKSEES